MKLKHSAYVTVMDTVIVSLIVTALVLEWHIVAVSLTGWDKENINGEKITVDNKRGYSCIC
jgi:hypothetical protein